MKKPLPVKIVEALGWTYVALSVVWIIVLIVAQVFGIDQEGEVWPLVLCGSFPLLLSLGMVLSLRRGRSGWFLVPNTVVFSLFLLGAIVSLTSLEGAVIAGVIALLLVAPIALLWSPSASRWFNTMSGDDSPGPVGCALGMLLVFLGSIGGCFVSDYQTRNYTRLARLHAMSFRARELSKMMAENEGAGKSGAEWIDPAVCTNSTQFVRALMEKAGLDIGCEDFWCVAVNPPDDDIFPVLVTANIDPRELLNPSDADARLTLVCPKKVWGGVCRDFCEKGAVVVYKNGVSQTLKRKWARPWLMFRSADSSRDDIPKPGPETYFLTPTGRVDFVERQAADWLSIHEFASNEDSGDVSVKWRVAWPESLSGLNNEGLSSVRREILQMTFGPAWSDLNHGDKTWIPPPTIEEAEEEIKRKLEEPDIVWEFSGDVELDRPFGASPQDGAEWYARPVIAAKNDGNSSFRRECGCTYYTIARTFSIPDGREMTVDDYFDRGKMKELSALVWRRLLESVFPFDDETRKGMGHRDINLRDRNLIFMRVMSGGICFYFAPYSIFSGADGVTKAFLKWGELSKFRKK